MALRRGPAYDIAVSINSYHTQTPGCRLRRLDRMCVYLNFVVRTHMLSFVRTCAWQSITATRVPSCDADFPKCRCWMLVRVRSSCDDGLRHRCTAVGVPCMGYLDDAGGPAQGFRPEVRLAGRWPPPHHPSSVVCVVTCCVSASAGSERVGTGGCNTVQQACV